MYFSVAMVYKTPDLRGKQFSQPLRKLMAKFTSTRINS